MYDVPFFVFMTILALTLAEGPFTKFGYDEALLEKMIRNEIKFEQLQEKVEASLDRVDSTLKVVQETVRKMREEFEHMNQTVFVKVVEEFMKESTDSIDQQKEEIGRMWSFYNDLRNNLTESKSIPVIGFKATGIVENTPSVGDILAFTTVISNPGNGYDASTGIFTAPVDGLYLFTTQMCMYTNKYITASIMVDKTEVGTSFTYDSNSYPCNTGDAIAVVKAAQKVFVKIKQVSGSFYQNFAHSVSFAGALLNKEK